MAYTLFEYADWLDERDLRWPKAPAPDPPKATPYLKKLPGIRAVTWSLYGTLLRISDGQLLFEHPQRLRMQVALEKTIEEFRMWYSMVRKPGAPWEIMLHQYKDLLDQHRMAGTGHKGDVPEIDSSAIWKKLLERLFQKEYEYDTAFYGDLDEYSIKVAYFFHASLQGVAASDGAIEALTAASGSTIRQGLLADAQPFSIMQLMRGLRRQGTPPSPGDLFDFDCSALSFQEGLRKPSPSLYRACAERLEEEGIAPQEVLHVGSRVRDDLEPAKRAGMRTALYAGDKSSLQAPKEDLKDPQRKPDRLLTDLRQICDVLDIG